MDVLDISKEDCCLQKVLTELKELKASYHEKNEVDHYTTASEIYEKFIQENISK